MEQWPESRVLHLTIIQIVQIFRLHLLFFGFLHLLKVIIDLLGQLVPWVPGRQQQGVVGIIALQLPQDLLRGRTRATVGLIGGFLLLAGLIKALLLPQAEIYRDALWVSLRGALWRGLKVEPHPELTGMQNLYFAPYTPKHSTCGRQFSSFFENSTHTFFLILLENSIILSE